MPTEPMLWFDYEPDGKPITPCLDCHSWYAEVLMVDGLTIVREWHAAGCITWCETPQEA